MTDGIIKGTGNSRYLKTVAAALELYPTYADFMAALIAGTLPVDLNGINNAGWDTLPTWLNKANLLADATAEKLGLGADATPNEALDVLSTIALAAGNAKVFSGSYTGTGAQSGPTISIGGTADILFVWSTTSGALLIGAKNAQSMLSVKATATTNSVTGFYFSSTFPFFDGTEFSTGTSIDNNASSAKYQYLAIGK